VGRFIWVPPALQLRGRVGPSVTLLRSIHIALLGLSQLQAPTRVRVDKSPYHKFAIRREGHRFGRAEYHTHHDQQCETVNKASHSRGGRP